jgi:hypothetical protein
MMYSIHLGLLNLGGLLRLDPAAQCLTGHIGGEPLRLLDGGDQLASHGPLLVKNLIDILFRHVVPEETGRRTFQIVFDSVYFSYWILWFFGHHLPTESLAQVLGVLNLKLR